MRTLRHGFFVAIAIPFVIGVVQTQQTYAASSAAPPKVTLSISSYYAKGSTFLGGAAVFETPAQTPVRNVDVYVGVHRPDGGFASALPGPDPVLLQAGLEPKAYATDLHLDMMVGVSFGYLFAGDEPAGFYVVYAILIEPGTDPLDSRNWINTAMTAFLYSP